MVKLRRGSWAVPPIFALIQEAGRIEEAEMFRTFNMGAGFLVIVPPEVVTGAIERLAAHGGAAWPIGEITPGPRGVEYL